MKKFLLAFLLLALLVPAVAKADGGIMPPPDYWIRETDQKAVIVHENGVETMIVSVNFEGDAKKFAWIVPTPSVPQVDKAPFNVFESLNKLTGSNSNIIYSRDSLSLGAPTAMEESVNIIEQKKVDVYDITVLQATGKNALYQWLQDNGFTYPEYGKVILDDYIKNGWTFSAIKIDAESLEVAGDQLKTGTITPLKFVFNSEKVVFPLKISAITMQNPNPKTRISETEMDSDNSSSEIVPIPTSAPTSVIPRNYMGILLYVFADHKKDAIGFNTQWANWIDKNDIEKLAFDSKGDAWYTPKAKELYLTKLYKNMNTSEMKDDIFLTDAEDNSPIPPSQTTEIILLIFMFLALGLISPFGMLFIIFILLFIFIRSRAAKISFLVVQGFLTLATIIFGAVFASIEGLDVATDPASIAFIIALSIFAILDIVAIILEIVLGRKKKIL